MIYGWSPEIGDPTIWGWLTVANYFAAFVLAAWAARMDWRHANFWIFISLTMAALGVNKQLDLQGLLTAIGREIAYQYDWYQDRRIVQKWFIEAIGIGALATTTLLVVTGRKSGAPVLVATVGITLTAGFVIARAASFHHMDELLAIRFVALRLNHILENSGIACVSVGAIWATVQSCTPRRGRRPKL